jgi:hypothetical protein
LLGTAGNLCDSSCKTVCIKIIQQVDEDNNWNSYNVTKYFVCVSVYIKS